MHTLNRRFSVRTLLGCATLILLHYALGLTATLHKCTAFDETFHITSGFAFNQYNDFRLHPENGVMPQRWVALPWIWCGLNFPATDQQYWHESVTGEVSHRFFYKLGNDADKLLFVGRAMNGLWSIAFGILLFVWTYREFGKGSAWITTALWATSPIFLAHDFIATSDAAAALLFLASVGSIWAAIHKLTWKSLVLSGVSIAMLFLSKFSAPIVIPMGVLMALTRLISNYPWRIQLVGSHILQLRHHIAVGMLLLASTFAATTWCAIWVGYGCRYSAFNTVLLGDGTWRLTWDKLLDSSNTIPQVVAVARSHRFLPEAYLYGFMQTHYFAQYRNAFLLGEFSPKGWKIFFPFCELVKTPTGTILLLGLAVLAIVVRCRLEEQHHRLDFVLNWLYRTTPLWSLFLVYWFFAISSHLNIGHRHVLPAEGPMLMLAGISAWWLRFRPRVGESSIPTTDKNRHYLFHRWRHPVQASMVIGCVIATITASLLAWPNYLSFFNLPSGGPKHAWKKLVDSSLDWGQELPSLRRWLDNEMAHNPSNEPFYLSYFGTGDPGYYGIQATMLPSFFDWRPPSFPTSLHPGVYCISATMLHALFTEFPGPWTSEQERQYQANRMLESTVELQYVESIWPTLSMIERAEWIAKFRTYEQLRFVKLTHTLRHREPNDSVNHSILIFRVNAEELAKALDEPSYDLKTEWNEFLDKL